MMSKSPLCISHVRSRLVRRRPKQLDERELRRAAVAVVLAEEDDDLEVLLIQRADRVGDPWSGHMAFPGGRHHPHDADLLVTATRETHEEVGLDLAAHGNAIGTLDDVRAIGNRRPIDLLIRPYVYEVVTKPPLRLDRREVRDAVWVPLSALARDDVRGVHRPYATGEFPAFVYRGFTIWGLTYRMLNSLLDVLR